jgi:hypothetical protein
MPRNQILADLRAAPFAGCDRWALDVVACRSVISEPARVMAWAHLKTRRGQAMSQTTVQRLAAERRARMARDAHHLPGGDAA